MLVFKVFNITDSDAVYDSTIEIDPDNSEYIGEIKKLFKLQKNKKVYIQPRDSAGVHFLTKPKPRGRTALLPDVIVFMHEQAVEHKRSAIQIMYDIHKKFGIELNMNQLKDVLSQKKYTDVPGIDHLREQARDLMPKKPDRRKKITDEMREEWDQLREEGMSGCAISKLYDVTPQSVNAHLRAQKQKRIQLVIKEQ